MAKSIFEENGGTYIKVGDYYVPDFGQFEKQEEEDQRPIGKYGSLRKTFLMNERKATFAHLLLSGQLLEHLRDVEQQAQDLLDRLIPLYKEKQGVTEEMKMKEQMKWVGMMNNIKAQVEEVVFSEIVYV